MNCSLLHAPAPMQGRGICSELSLHVIEILQRIYSSVFYLILYLINMVITINEDYCLYQGCFS